MKQLILIGGLLIPGLLAGQIHLVPIPKAPAKTKSNTRIQAETPLSLPFWDDFSFSRDVPSDTLWQESENVRINGDIGINPPSLNVASFDGITATGEAYSANPNAVGETDVLTSCPIDLSGHSVDDNVYLSFFYQFAGNGDPSEVTQGDSLVLEFFARPSPDSTVWIQVWPQNSSMLDRSTAFLQETVRLNNESFFYDSFQFRIRSFGRQSGIWDNWNIDYVYLNDNRSPTDLFYPDRTLSSGLNSIFDTFTAIPYDHFDFSQLVDPSFTIYNLDNASQTVQYDITARVDNFVGEDTVTFFDSQFDPVGQPSLSNLVDTVVAVPVLQETFFDASADSAYLSFEILFDSGDQDSIPNAQGEVDYDPEIYRPIDFRNNDTTRMTYVLSNYYAYDDGTAEFGAGFRTSSTQVAYQFELPEGITDNLVALDMYFPYLGTDPAGRSIDLLVWFDGSGEPGANVYQEQRGIIRSSTIDEFTRYRLRRSIEVSGTFYIGYRQNSDGDLRIGLDRNTNSTNRIFTRAGSFWTEERNLETGSLMIRPVFGEPFVEQSIDPELQENTRLYPNPGHGVFTLNTNAYEVQVFDAKGRIITPVKNVVGESMTLDITSYPNGLYFVQLVGKGKQFTFKVIKQ